MSPTLLKNTAAVMSSRVFNALAQLLVASLVARAFGAAGLGRLGFALAMGQGLALAADFGLSLLVTREVARDDGPGLGGAREALGLRFLTTSVALGAAAVLSVLLPDVGWVGFLVALQLLVRGLSRHATAVFYGRQRMELETAVLLGEAALVALVAWAAVPAAPTLDAFVAWLVLPYLGGLVLRWTILHRIAPGAGLPGLGVGSVKSTLRASWAYAGAGVSAHLYLQMDMLLVPWLLSQESAGVYQGALKIYLLLTLIPEALSQALLPAASRASDQPARVAAPVKSALHLLAVAAFPALVGGAVVADDLLGLLYGDAFRPFGVVLAVMLFGMPLRFSSYVFGTLLTALGAQRTRFAIALAAVFVAAALVLLLGGRGLVALATAKVATELFLASAYGNAATRRVGVALVPVSVLRTLPPAAAVGLAAWLLRDLPVLATIGGAILVYAVAAPLAGAVRLQDLTALVRHRSPPKEISS